MTYALNEESVADGTPFECYLFQSPNGSYRYTSLPFDVTLNGEVFKPLQIVRSSFDISAVVESLKTMDFTFPLNSVIANDYAGKNVPDYLTVLVYRAHIGDDLSTQFKIEWRGETTNYSIQNNKFVVKTRSIMQAKILGANKTVYYQLACNNRVYDDRCKAIKAEFTVATTVTALDNIRVTVGSSGSFGNGELSLGTMVNTRTGEERSIYNNTDGLIEVTYAFNDIVIGDEVLLILGCDNRMSTCVNRFDNVVNFTGFRYIPAKNPFAQG